MSKKLCDLLADGWINYPGIGKITDKQVADLVMEHTTLFDRIFKPRKIVVAGLLAQNILMKIIDEPKDKNWKF